MKRFLFLAAALLIAASTFAQGIKWEDGTLMQALKKAKESGKELVFLDCYATWCGPCQQLSPVIDKLAADHPELKVAKIDIDQSRELAKKHKIFSVPTLVVYKNGEITARATGVRSQSEILELI